LDYADDHEIDFVAIGTVVRNADLSVFCVPIDVNDRGSRS